MNQKNTIFNTLKKSLISTKKHPHCASIYFQLNFDENHEAYLKVVDSDGKEVDPNYRYYEEPIRSVLQQIERSCNNNNLSFSWGAEEEKLYFKDSPLLMDKLRQCDNVVDNQFSTINYAQHKGSLTLVLTGEDVCKATLKIKVEGEELNNLAYLSNKYVIIKNTIIEIKEIWGEITHLPLFETSIPRSDLEHLIALFLSYFENIPIKYDGYKFEEGNSVQTQQALILEKIDSDKSLYLRVTSSLKDADPDFLANFDILKKVTVVEDEKRIILQTIIYNDDKNVMDYLKKTLSKYKREIKEKSGQEYCIEGDIFIIEEKLAHSFIQNELHYLLDNFVIFGLDKIKSYKIHSVYPKLNLTIKSNSRIDFLEGDASIEINGEEFTIFDALHQYKKNKYIQLNDGEKAIINPTYIDKLKRLFKISKEKVQLSFFDLPLVEDLIDEKTIKGPLLKSRKIISGFNTISTIKIKKHLVKATLREYQKQGVQWLSYLHQHQLGGCLADDMGLGKTIQTLCLLSSIYPKEKKPSLIIMPKSLVFNWESEIKKFCPQLKTYIYYGNTTDIKEAMKHHLILTTYGKVRSDIETLKENTYYYVILDESQNIKNIQSQSSKAVMLLNGSYRLALSGTPIENNLGELYSLFRFLNPTMFGSVQEFNENYSIPIQKTNNSEVMKELKKKIYPFILRRLKKDVLTELPDKIEKILYVDMSSAQKTLYEKRRRFFYDTVKSQVKINGIGKSQFAILQALTELRQIATIPESKTADKIISPKREILIQEIIDATANGHKILVFANFLHAVEKISNDLEDHNIGYLTMTGATRDRETLVNKFQNDDHYKVFVVTLKTGSLGLNLTQSDMVFIFDPWWNVAAENQAIDRAHRMGQDKTVFSYKLITRGTIEEKILLLQKNKKELFNSLISSDSSSIKSLNENDIDFILGSKAFQ